MKLHMVVATTCKELVFDEAMHLVEDGAAFVDLRRIDEYLDVHIPGSLALLYEFGPGMAARARDCLPLSLPLILSDPGGLDIDHAANSLRGKGFTVLGRVDDAINRWAQATGGTPASTEVVRAPNAPKGTVLDVGDPGATVGSPAGMRIPIERLWSRIDDVAGLERVVLAVGYGVRAALAVGILERAGIPDVVFWRTRG
jgi:rhodanese-related sulfurtransferase